MVVCAPFSFMRPQQTGDAPTFHWAMPALPVSLFPLDVATMMNTLRENAMAAARAQQLIIESAHATQERQAALLSDLAVGQAELWHEWLDSNTPEEKIAGQSAVLRDMYEKTIGQCREIADLARQSTQTAADVIHGRVSRSLAEVQTAVAKTAARRKG